MRVFSYGSHDPFITTSETDPAMSRLALAIAAGLLVGVLAVVLLGGAWSSTPDRVPVIDLDAIDGDIATTLPDPSSTTVTPPASTTTTPAPAPTPTPQIVPPPTVSPAPPPAPPAPGADDPDDDADDPDDADDDADDADDGVDDDGDDD